MRARLLGAALLAATGGLIAIVPARAQLGLPPPPGLPSLLPATPSLLPGATPQASVICKIPSISGVWFYANDQTGTIPPPASPAPGQQPAPSPTHYAAVGATGSLIITGTNLSVSQPPGCTATVTFDHMPSAPNQLPPLVPGTSGGQDTLGMIFSAQSPQSSLPAGLYGTPRVVETDPLKDQTTSDADTDRYVFAESPSGVTFPDTIINEGTTVTISTASGLAPFQPNQAASLPAASTSFNFAGCDGLTLNQTGQPPADATKLDTTVSFQIPAAYCDGPVTATFASVYDTNQSTCTPSQQPNAPPIDPVKCAAITIIEPAGAIDVHFEVNTIAPNPIAPGGTLQVTGSGFGTSGTGNIAGVPTPVTFWSDHLIYLAVPTSAKTGVLNLCRGSGDQLCFQTETITVQAGAPTGPPGLGSYGGGPNPGPSGSPVPYVPGFHAGGPMAHGGATTAAHHDLTLSVGRATGAPGADIDFTVTLVVNGKPVAGAPVAMSVLSAPGPDAKVTPGSGVTDASGILRGILHLSSKVGDHLLLAQSGIYADEVHVTGQTPAGSASTSLPFGLGNLNILTAGNPLVVWLSVATAALIVLGVLVNINVLRRFAWAVTMGRLIARMRRPRPA